LFIKETPTLTG